MSGYSYIFLWRQCFYFLFGCDRCNLSTFLLDMKDALVVIFLLQVTVSIGPHVCFDMRLIIPIFLLMGVVIIFCISIVKFVLYFFLCLSMLDYI